MFLMLTVSRSKCVVSISEQKKATASEPTIMLQIRQAVVEGLKGSKRQEGRP
jgi:hypothetical protein